MGTPGRLGARTDPQMLLGPIKIRTWLLRDQQVPVHVVGLKPN